MSTNNNNNKTLKLIRTRQKDLYVEIANTSRRSFLIAKCRLIVGIVFLCALVYALYDIGVFSYVNTHGLSEIKPTNFSNNKYQQKISTNESITQQNLLDSEIDLNSQELNRSFIHVPRDICTQQQQQPTPFLLLLVKSRVSSFKQREVIRRTWGALDQLGFVRRVFLVGRASPSEDLDNENVTKLIEIENSKYGDIIQPDFYDSYKMNTVKILMAFKWVFENCSQVNICIFEVLLD